MTLPERLAVESLLSDISEINKSLNSLSFHFNGPGWKRPNIKAREFNLNLQSFQFSPDSNQNVKNQLALLEILVDRLHFLLLSVAESGSNKFISIGKASKILMTKIAILKQAKQDINSNFENIQEHINQTIASRGSELFYSPNYEEDLRREMFPIVANLITTVTSICDQNGIPSASCKLWEAEKARVNKKIFVNVTTEIRKDMERISRLFQKLEKNKISLKKEIELKNGEIKAKIASAEGLRATIKRKEIESERNMNDLNDQFELRISVTEAEKREIFKDRNRLKAELSKCTEEINNKTDQIHNVTQERNKIEKELLEKNHQNIILNENINQKITEIGSLKQQILNSNGKLENEKKTKDRLKSKLIEISENENELQNQIENLKGEVEQIEAKKNVLENSIFEVSKKKDIEIRRNQTDYDSYRQKCSQLVCPGCIQLTANHQASQISITAAGDTRANNLQFKLSSAESRVTEMEKELKLLAAYPDLNINIRTKYYSDRIGPPENATIQIEMENQIKANQKRIQLITAENNKLFAALGRLEESIVDSDSISERFESQSRIASTIEDLENIEDLEDDISIPSTLSATVREPSRIGSSRKFQGQVYNRSSRRVASPMYLSTSHRVNSAGVNSPCVQWNSGRR